MIGRLLCRLGFHVPVLVKVPVARPNAVPANGYRLRCNHCPRYAR